MKLFHWIRNYFQGLEAKHISRLNWVERFLRFQKRFWPTVNRRLWVHSAYELSSALSYQTLFALIPVLVLMAVLFKAFGGIEDSKKNLRELLESAGISQIAVADTSATPDESTEPTEKPPVVNLGDKIEQLVDAIESKITLGSLGPVSVLLLIWTALNLLTTMEQALNRIFGAEHNRSLAKRIMLYWATLTLIPLVILVLSYVSQIVMSHSLDVRGISWIVLKTTGWIGSLVLTVFVMICLYKYLPNTHISLRTALFGAILAAPLWMAAKWGFGLYIKYAATNSFYGAVGVIPVFMFWLYISWLVFLLGAEIAYTAANLDRIRSIEEDENLALGPSELLAGAFVVARAYQMGKPPISMDEIRRHINLPDITLQRIFDRLCKARIILPVEKDEQLRSFVPARPSDQVALLDIFELSPQHFQSLNAVPYYDQQVTQGIEKVYQLAYPSLGKVTLADIVAEVVDVKR
ncbi:MAG: YihY/virulence factor BrkB family protein [Phycisphaerae bacterium]|nr:YihY/virulence factor BrkB family protein [Phycisphaerae bacterium]